MCAIEGTPMTETVTIPKARYEAMCQRLEDMNDILAAQASLSWGDGLPSEFAKRVMRGEHPVRVWREYRGMTALALAEAAKVSNTYLSEIETGKKPGSVEVYKAIAAALNVKVDTLLI